MRRRRRQRRILIVHLIFWLKSGLVTFICAEIEKTNIYNYTRSIKVKKKLGKPVVCQRVCMYTWLLFLDGKCLLYFLIRMFISYSRDDSLCHIFTFNVLISILTRSPKRKVKFMVKFRILPVYSRFLFFFYIVVIKKIIVKFFYITSCFYSGGNFYSSYKFHCFVTHLYTDTFC